MNGEERKAAVWEPRDPPLQYSGIPDEGKASKSRLEPRRSASLSQADLVGGKTLGQHQHHALQSPPRPPPPQEASPASRYQDYYETKYERPVRRQDVPLARGRPGVDIDAVLKARWRSSSPPPAPVDDWLPIKPPQLAWAKPVVPVVELPARGGRKATRIPLPVSSSMARSASSDMDHMIYLERDLPDVMLRERTRSIDRLAAPSAGNRIAYKTYEEELADYHGRTGSVDRLAVTRRPRTTIRMGTQSTAGRSVPVSLERRHSEISVDRSASRRRESGDSSGNSSSGRQHGSAASRRGSVADVSDVKAAPTRSANNVNRVYIDGSGPEEGAVAPRMAHPAIRVTMTDTRSLKRPTQKLPAPVVATESSTMPRMSKRQGVTRQGPATKPAPGAVQQHPGATTVYLAQDEPFGGAPTPPAPARTLPRADSEAGRKTTPKRMRTDADGVPGNVPPVFSLPIALPPPFYFHLSPIMQTVL